MPSIIKGNKMLIRMSGYLYEIKAKLINENEIYKIKNIEDVKSKYIFNDKFIGKSGLKIINNLEEIEITNIDSFNLSSYKHLYEAEKDNIILDDENFELINLVESLSENHIIYQIEKKSFVSPSFKIKESDLKQFKINTESVDFSSLTDGLIDDMLFQKIFYDKKRIELEKRKFIFLKEKSKEKKENKMIYIFYNDFGLLNLEHKIAI
jgi:hypothetical protein